MIDLGKAIDSATIQRGLQELNADLHFDMGAALNQWHPYIEYRQGVFYKGKHICSMDRGNVPEYKVWTVADREVPCSFGEADDEGVVLRYKAIPPNVPGYFDLYEDAKVGRLDEYQVRADGTLIRLEAVRITKVRDRVVSVGWRHTFERLLKVGVPGITRRSLGEKFTVDMYKYPVGPPEEMLDALTQE